MSRVNSTFLMPSIAKRAPLLAACGGESKPQYPINASADYYHERLTPGGHPVTLVWISTRTNHFHGYEHPFPMFGLQCIATGEFRLLRMADSCYFYSRCRVRIAPNPRFSPGGLDLTGGSGYDQSQS
jgi:hypothetical protein